jgi:hypothetical protein
MPDRNLTGLAITRSERILVVALSWLFTAPLVFAYGKRIFVAIRGTPVERERLRRVIERRDRAQRVLRDYQARLERERETAERER